MEAIATERRLAAILAADVVGYSRLVENDEAGTFAALKKLRREVIDPLLARHRGRIVKLMGDGLIAEFGSAVDAVRCAAAVQRAARSCRRMRRPEHRLRFRIGINLGDVVVDGEDLLGDGVNIAARLEQLCDPGGVLVSGTAYDQLQGKLDLPLEYLGEQQVKNIARPVRAYRVRLDGKPAPPWRLRLRQRCAGFSRWRPRCSSPLAVYSGRASGGSGRPTRRAPTASIAVLPFDNLGGDEATGRLADGITEDIITDLSPVSGIRGDRPQLDRGLQGQGGRHSPGRHAT